MALTTSKHLLTYAISDISSLTTSLTDFVRLAADAGVDMLQIREKELTDRELVELASACLRVRGKKAMKILINDRLDIALAVGADGVHLGNHSVNPAIVRAHAPENFIIGVSTHSLAEAKAAEAAGADFITFGPVFYTASKAPYGPPVGLASLRDLVKQVKTPILPLGGIVQEKLSEFRGINIAGVAAISMFQHAISLPAVVSSVRNMKERT